MKKIKGKPCKKLEMLCDHVINNQGAPLTLEASSVYVFGALKTAISTLRYVSEIFETHETFRKVWPHSSIVCIESLQHMEDGKDYSQIIDKMRALQKLKPSRRKTK